MNYKINEKLLSIPIKIYKTTDDINAYGSSYIDDFEVGNKKILSVTTDISVHFGGNTFVYSYQIINNHLNISYYDIINNKKPNEIKTKINIEIMYI